MSEQLIQTPGTFGDNGNFLLERELGSGGMGGVYMGRDKMLDRPVAVKVMLKEYGADAEFVEKFKKEAQSVARLIHPNIAQVYSYGICDGMPYIAMELAAGGSLYSIMNANPGKTDVARVIKICQQVAQALQCASDQGCVHGDVKPENILLDANGNAKLVDFGLAAMQKDTNEIWGTPYYISPEKVKKEPIDFRADMYSLGGTLYHALTGVAPFEGEDSIAVVKKRFEGMPKKPSEIRPDLTPAIDELVMKMLAMGKEDRFPSFEALLESFRSVLTTGLSPTATGKTEAKPTAGGGTRKMTTVRGRRMAIRRPGTTTAAKRAPDAEEGNEGALDDAEKPSSEEDEEEGGGNLGLKVIGIVVGAILLVGGVIGGLLWYQVADKKARAAEEQSQIVGGIERARAAIRDTVANAEKFADDFDAFASKAIEACQHSTDELVTLKVLPEDQCALLKPGPSKELLAAIAATNDAPPAADAPVTPTTNAAPTAVATTNAATTASNTAPAKASAPASTNASPAAAKVPQTPAKQEKPAEQLPAVVIAMNELWERAYGCQASAVRIRHSVRQIGKKAQEAETYREQDRQSMEKLAELSRTLVELLDQVKTSKDVDNVRKGITYIKSKGESTVKQAVTRMRIENLEKARKKKADDAAAAEEDRKKKQAEERKAKVDAETAAAAAKFEAVVAMGCLRQLDWKTAARQLENLKADTQTAEGQIAVDLELRKVAAMKKMQDVLIKAMKGYVFKKGKLRGLKVVAISEKEIQVEGGKNKHKLSWQKFYSTGYYSNLIEALNQFVFNGRKNARLSQRDVAEALTGGALFLSLVCTEADNASALSEKLALETVKQFPDYLPIATNIFSQIEFPAPEE